MSKILKDKNNETGYGYAKASRWLKVEYTIVSKKHRLANYTDKDTGKDLWLTYFKYKNKQYALGQFLRLETPIVLEDGTTLCAYDSVQWYNPLLLEISADGEFVRLWEQKDLKEN